MKFLFEYVPTTYTTNDRLKEEYLTIRHNIWDFKNGILRSHSIFSSDVIFEINRLKSQHSDKKIIIIPIPASTFRKTENRFFDFCNDICEKTKIVNGFNFIVSEPTPPAHLGGSRNDKVFSLNPNISIDSNSIIVLFDDIYTSGNSFRIASRLFSNSVIEGIFLGKTIDRYDIDFYCK